jgi:glutamate synthase (NADPH) small chain
MADPQGFLQVKRTDNPYRPSDLRVQDFAEIETLLPADERQLQASRCMDCGVPFCHWGCPISNLIPEWQDKLYHGDWQAAYELLQRTNNFPEFTGRVCPAPCEGACVLEIHDQSVTIRANELAIIEHAFEVGYVQPQPPAFRTGKKVAVIGSGPAGLAGADELNKMGHSVILYETAAEVGGYLRYGIPDFKLDKAVIDRRVDLLQQEGLEIVTNVKVGVDISVDELNSKFDAVCLAIGARIPRDLPIPGRELNGIHFAVDYLTQQNQNNAGVEISVADQILATDKHVVVIGGGDTGADCVGTAIRQGAKSVTQLEILPQPPTERKSDNPWPLWPQTLRTSSSHKEGCTRHFSLATQKFQGKAGRVQKLATTQVNWQPTTTSGYKMVKIPNTDQEFPADLVLLAMGFLQVETEGLIAALGIQQAERGNLALDGNMMSNIPGIFAAGDAQRGPALIVWAIQDGRTVARSIDQYLRG